jgi:hypothetical protein
LETCLSETRPSENDNHGYRAYLCTCSSERPLRCLDRSRVLSPDESCFYVGQWWFECEGSSGCPSSRSLFVSTDGGRAMEKARWSSDDANFSPPSPFLRCNGSRPRIGRPALALVCRLVFRRCVWDHSNRCEPTDAPRPLIQRSVILGTANADKLSLNRQ